MLKSLNASGGGMVLAARGAVTTPGADTDAEFAWNSSANAKPVTSPMVARDTNATNSLKCGNLRIGPSSLVLRNNVR
jgi:hypothetical protein